MLSGFKQIKANNNDNKNELINPGFIRIKLIQLDPAPNNTVEKTLFCAVNIRQLVKDDEKLNDFKTQPIRCDLMPNEYRKKSIIKKTEMLMLPF